jgi:hypothetical protein
MLPLVAKLLPMKKLLTCFVAASAISAQAQITLNQAGYTGTYVGADTIKRATAGQTYPSMAPATNVTWDLSTLNYPSGANLYYRMTFSGSAFPGASMYDSMYYPLAGAVGYTFSKVSGIDANAYQYFGERLFRQGIPLGSFTSNPMDSVVVLAQDVVYSTPRKIIAFPATMGSTWTGSYNYSTNMTITVALAGYNAAPALRKTYVTYSDSVVGWGSMKVPTVSGGASGNMSVLMVRHREMQIDSFFINGSPAPSQILGALGLTQGQSSEENNVFFYRAGEITPLANVEYLNSTFAQSQIKQVETHSNRLAIAASIASVSRYGKVALYPNPLTGDQLAVSIEDKGVRTLQYDVMNINGQVIAKGDLNMNSGTGYMNMSNAKASGIYYVRLYEGGQLLTTLPLSIN